MENREELIKLVNEFAIVECWKDGYGIDIKLDMVAAGFIKPYQGLMELFKVMYPEYDPIADNFAENGIIRMACQKDKRYKLVLQ